MLLISTDPTAEPLTVTSHSQTVESKQVKCPVGESTGIPKKRKDGADQNGIGDEDG